MGKPRRPADLGPRGARLWRALVNEIEVDVDDGSARPGTFELLTEACRTLDILDRIDRELVGNLVVAGSQGQARPHPLLGARSAFLADLADLLGRLR